MSPKAAGFIFLAMPVNNVKPLDLLFKSDNGTVTRLNSSIEKLFLPVNSLPPLVGAEKNLPNTISCEEQLSLAVESNIKLLEGLKKLLKVGVEGGFSLDKSEVYTYTIIDAKHQYVDFTDIDYYIHDNPLNEKLETFSEGLKKDDMYVVTEIIKSKSFVISRASSGKTKANAEITAEGLATVEASAGGQQSKENKYEYHDEEYLVLAVKAIRILYDKPFWFSKEKGKYRVEVDPKVELVKSPEEMQVEVLEVPGGIITF